MLGEIAVNGDLLMCPLAPGKLSGFPAFKQNSCIEGKKLKRSLLLLPKNCTIPIANEIQCGLHMKARSILNILSIIQAESKREHIDST